MPVQNREIAAIFEEMAEMLAIQNANPFRVRAYSRAAMVVQNLPKSVDEMLRLGEDLTQLEGIGKDLAKKMAEIVRTGHLKDLEKLKAQIPEGILELLKIPSLGPKRVGKLYKTLHIKNLADLKKAVTQKKIRELEGFGEKIEEEILQELSRKTDESRRFSWIDAHQLTLPLFRHLQQNTTIDQIKIAGSYRRHQESVGDIDILVTSQSPKSVMESFLSHSDIAKIVTKGESRLTVILRAGLQVDLRVVKPENYGSALLYFTGSKSHNIALRKRAQGRGLKISEYGIFKEDRRLGGESEEEIYRLLGLQFIPPELREERGEIKAAEAGKLPKIISMDDLKGDLHVHTSESDGQASLEKMAAAALEKGLEYLAITDHSKHVGITQGLDTKRLMNQIRIIDRFNAKSKKITLLKGMEVDILEDGRLALPDEILKELDLTVCSIHTQLHLPEKKQTERILRAMDNPHFKIWGHPTGRLINERWASEVNMEKILMEVQRRKKFVEVNAQPLRLDLNDHFCRMAKDLGVMLVISSDAHAENHFDYLPLGVAQAARGWIEAKDVLNTRPLAEVIKLLRESGRGPG